MMGYEQIFEGIICGYEVRIILSSEGVVINLWQPIKRRHYEANLPYELDGKSKEVQEIFTNLDAFYVYFTEYAEDKERVFINENGRITVVYQMQKSKNKRFPTVQIDTQVLLAGPQIKHQLKLSNEVGTVKRENRKLQAQIQQLEELIHKNEDEMKNLIKVAKVSTAKVNDTASEVGGKQYSILSEGGKSGVIQLKQTLGTVMDEMKQFKTLVGDTKVKQDNAIRKNGHINLKQKINSQRKRESSQSQEKRERKQRKQRKKEKKRREKEKRKKHRKHRKRYSSEDQTESSRQSPIKDNIKKTINIDDRIDPEFGNPMWITVDPNNQYLASQYKIQGNKITKINGYGRYQILSKQVIPPKGKHYFDMHIVRVSFQLFSLGIVAQRRRNNKNSHEHEDLVSYFSRTGAIWEQGSHRNGGKRIPNGVEVRIVVDMDKHTVKWYMDKQQFAGTVLSEKLWNERLVAYLEFNYQDDVVYWNTIDEPAPNAIQS